MLTMQMIKIMDRLWLKSGLDLKIITFACLATGPKKGKGNIQFMHRSRGTPPHPGKLKFLNLHSRITPKMPRTTPGKLGYLLDPQ